MNNLEEVYKKIREIICDKSDKIDSFKVVKNSRRIQEVLETPKS